MLFSLTEHQYKKIGFVDSRTVLRPECQLAREITTSELRRLGYGNQIIISEHEIVYGPDEVIEAIDVVGQNWSGEWWTSAVLADRSAVLAFRNHRDAIVFMMSYRGQRS